MKSLVRFAILGLALHVGGLDVEASTATTGGLRGVVRDASGVPLANARVDLTGSGIGSRSTLTDEIGEYRFVFIPPSSGYVLEVKQSGFEPVRQKVVIALGNEYRLDIQLRLVISGEIEVVASTPRVDVLNSHVSTNITAEEFGLLPTRRDFQQLTTIAPGVMMDNRNGSSPTVSGSSHLENDYIIEGLSTRDPRYGSSATNLTMNFVQEIQAVTMNASAEYGRSMGGVFNVITRSGTNQFAGEVSAYFEDSDWGSDNIKTGFRGTTTTDLGHDRRDYGVSLGGPLRRDRAWFFGAYGPRHEVTPFELISESAGVNRIERKIREEDVYAGKLTFAVTSSQSLTLSAFGNPVEVSGWQGDVLWDPTTSLWTDYSGSENAVLRHHAALSSQSWLELTAGRHRQSLYALADTAVGAAAPFQIDFTSFPYAAHGGIPGGGKDTADRRLVSLRGTQLFRQHELRAGVELERNRYDSFRNETYYSFYGPTNVSSEVGVRDVLEVFSFGEEGYGTNDALSVFLDDRFRLSERITVTAGLRWERQTVDSSRGVVLVDRVHPNGTVDSRPADDFTFDNNWAPRLGIVWDPSGRGRSKVFAAAGRYFGSIPVNVNVAFLNGFGYDVSLYYSDVPQTSASWFNPTGSPVNENWIRYDQYDGRTLGGIDPSTKLQYQDEYSLGGEMQFGANMTFGVRAVNRLFGRVIDDRGTWNENNLRMRRNEYFLVNPGESDLGSVFRTPQRNYSALELTFHRRLADRWQVISSFVSARARGDYDGYVEYSSTQFTNVGSPNTGYAFDVLRFEDNAYGRLRSDRPYQFKLHSSYTFPFGLTVSESFFYTSGIPVSALAAPGLSRGKRVLYFTPRGSEGRTPDVWTLDLKAQWEIPVRRLRGASAAVIADVFNATDNHGVLEVDEAYIFPGMPGIQQWIAPSNLDQWGFPKYDPSFPRSPFYGTPRVYQSPRAIQLGVRLRY